MTKVKIVARNSGDPIPKKEAELTVNAPPEYALDTNIVRNTIKAFRKRHEEVEVYVDGVKQE